ncbi:MAG TPA: purine-binding chemotaxis protein CheW [Bacteroidetes bacterium]|nr:purine-binding chemotaxis protein CheW [Bacteroidota bacterium]
MKEKSSESNEGMQLVIFRVGEEEFGVEITKVKEIIRLQEITRVPKAPPFVEGVINLRGRIVPVIDLRKRLGWQAKEPDKKARIIVAENHGHLTGLIVDAVTEVLRVPEKTAEFPSTLSTGVNRRFIRAIGILGERLIIMLDMDHVLNLEEEHQLAASVVS